jgi:hypothetical protein
MFMTGGGKTAKICEDLTLSSLRHDGFAIRVPPSLAVGSSPVNCHFYQLSFAIVTHINGLSSASRQFPLSQQGNLSSKPLLRSDGVLTPSVQPLSFSELKSLTDGELMARLQAGCNESRYWRGTRQ